MFIDTNFSKTILRALVFFMRLGVKCEQYLIKRKKVSKECLWNFDRNF